MGIALLAVSTLAHPLTALNRWWNRQRAPMRSRSPLHATLLGTASLEGGSRPAVEQPPSPTGKHPVCAAPGILRLGQASEAACRPAARTLRTTHPSPSAIRVLRSRGRMVIAGRMADVCAELERLAACEPQH